MVPMAQTVRMERMEHLQVVSLMDRLVAMAVHQLQDVRIVQAVLEEQVEL